MHCRVSVLMSVSAGVSVRWWSVVATGASACAFVDWVLARRAGAAPWRRWGIPTRWTCGECR